MAIGNRPCKPLDRKRLLEDCDEEASFANQCLRLYVRDTRIDIECIEAALGSRDFSRVARLAHRIKGASASIRAQFMSEMAARLHVFGEQGLEHEVSLCFAQLRKEFDKFERFIATLPLL
jgi:HPt (histidine-containing phosphotransfer) domain-containing protein